MLVDVSRESKKLNLEVDVCILGGGVAGITLAHELRAAYGSIAILESGTEQYDQATQELYTPEKQHGVYPDVLYSRMRFLGGSSNHWENNTAPFLGIDFEKRDWVQNSGWPITMADVQPHYTRAAEYCGVGSDGYGSRYWSEQLKVDFPYKPTDEVEMNVSKFASPPTRFFDRHGAALKEAREVTVYTRANVVDVSFDAASKKIRKAQFTSDGQLVHEISARVFVLCMGGIENARMLLHFNAKNGNQLGNQFDNVGRYFMDHPTLRPANLYTDRSDLIAKYELRQATRYVQAYLEFTEATLRKNAITNSKFSIIKVDNYQMSDGISSFHVLREQLARGNMPDDSFTHLSNMVVDLDMVIEAVARKSFDLKVFDHADEFAGFQIHAMVEQTPSRNNRVMLGQQKDRLGIPKVVMDWRLEQKDIDMMWAGLLVLGREFGKKSFGRLRMLKEQAPRLFTSQLGFGHHHMGTTRMAETPQTGVVDRNQRVFGTENFYVAGSSVFVTGSHVPPTLTLVALTLRLAKHLGSLEKKA